MEINGENINIEDIIKTQKPDFLKTRLTHRNIKKKRHQL